MDFLIYRMRGPLASWGVSLSGNERASHPFPTKSASLGLLGACLGIQRDDPRVDAFYQGYGAACRVDATGTVLKDFHTAQMPKKSVMKELDTGYFTRAALLEKAKDAKKETENTVLSDREYYQDAWYRGCVWVKNPAAPFSLEEIQEALLQPAYMPFLGRKCCTLSMPLSPAIVQAESPVEALTRPLDEDLLKLIHPHLDFPPEDATYYWEGVFPGIVPRRQAKIRDEVISRSRWLFADRVVYSRRGI